MSDISHYIDGKRVEGTSGRWRRRLQSGDRREDPPRRASPAPREVDRGGAGRGRGVPRLGRDPAADPRPHPVQVPRTARAASTTRSRGSITAEHGKVLSDAAGRGHPRHRGRRVRLRHPASAEGRVHRAGRPRHRQLVAAPAARRLRRHHAVQLPGDGADVDVPDGDRLRQHLHPEAVGARSVGRLSASPSC